MSVAFGAHLWAQKHCLLPAETVYPVATVQYIQNACTMLKMSTEKSSDRRGLSALALPKIFWPMRQDYCP